jgi:hypothetical protein
MAADDQAQSPFGKRSHQIDKLRGTGTVIGRHSLPGGRSNESVHKLHFVNGAGFEWCVHFVVSSNTIWHSTAGIFPVPEPT